MLKITNNQTTNGNGISESIVEVEGDSNDDVLATYLGIVGQRHEQAVLAVPSVEAGGDSGGQHLYRLTEMVHAGEVGMVIFVIANNYDSARSAAEESCPDQGIIPGSDSFTKWTCTLIVGKGCLGRFVEAADIVKS